MGSLSDIQLRSWVRSGVPIAGKSDGNGLTFTLSKNGVATWILRYRIAGKAKELTIGRYPDISLMEARKIAAAKRVEVQQVVDVAAIKQKRKLDAKASMNVAELSELWIDNAIRPRHQNPQITERVFRRDILPALGRFETKIVTMADVTRLLAKINASGRPTIANDALRHLKAMFAYGEVLGAVEKNPAERIKIIHAGGREKARTRVLSKSELTKLFSKISEAGIKFGRENELAIKLLLALGCRKMELLGSRWQEFDFDKQQWRIPSDRVKTNEPRELHLAKPVIEWLEELKVRACASEYVFPARRISKAQRFPHVSPDTTWRALQDLGHSLETFTIHDLRRTSRSLMADLGVPFDVAEKILGHKLPGVSAIYDRSNSAVQQIQALDCLANFVISITEPKTSTNLVPLVRRA